MSSELAQSRGPAVRSELAQATWPELADVDSILLVPLGATEQHGPHLPLGTDTEIALAITRAAAAARDDVLVAPPIAYGSSGEHDGFSGTISIGQPATELLIVELCRSASATFRRVMLVCTHGGNAAPLRRALATLLHEGRDVRSFVPDWGGDAHAGQTETSLMLAIDPQRVRSDRAQAGETRALPELIGVLRSARVSQLSPNGVLGDPAGATEAAGRAMLAAAARELLAELEGWV